MAIISRSGTAETASSAREERLDSALYNTALKSAASTFLFSRETALADAAQGRMSAAAQPAVTIAKQCESLALHAGIDPETARSACLHAIGAAIFAGRGATLQIDMSANITTRDRAWIQCSVKYYMSTLAFLAAPPDADGNIAAFLCEAGEREDPSYESGLDEIRYIFGAEHSVGRKEFFIKKVMRIYAVSRPKKSVHGISPEFLTYIESLDDYNSALFVRIDRFAKKKEIVISEERGSLDEIRRIMTRYGYEFHSNERFGSASFSFWSSDLGSFEKSGFDEIMRELEQAIHG